jgi:hypothetical protein
MDYKVALSAVAVVDQHDICIDICKTAGPDNFGMVRGELGGAVCNFSDEHIIRAIGVGDGDWACAQDLASWECYRNCVVIEACRRIDFVLSSQGNGGRVVGQDNKVLSAFKKRAIGTAVMHA